jgi:hypothetical protein
MTVFRHEFLDSLRDLLLEGLDVQLLKFPNSLVRQGRFTPSGDFPRRLTGMERIGYFFDHRVVLQLAWTGVAHYYRIYGQSVLSNIFTQIMEIFTSLPGTRALRGLDPPAPPPPPHVDMMRLSTPRPPEPEATPAVVAQPCQVVVLIRIDVLRHTIQQPVSK